jgi:hypothetical protein
MSTLEQLSKSFTTATLSQAVEEVGSTEFRFVDFFYDEEDNLELNPQFKAKIEQAWQDYANGKGKRTHGRP